MANVIQLQKTDGQEPKSEALDFAESLRAFASAVEAGRAKTGAFYFIDGSGALVRTYYEAA